MASDKINCYDQSSYSALGTPPVGSGRRAVSHTARVEHSLTEGALQKSSAVPMTGPTVAVAPTFRPLRLLCHRIVAAVFNFSPQHFAIRTPRIAKSR